jgi:hypothetical protein
MLRGTRVLRLVFERRLSSSELERHLGREGWVESGDGRSQGGARNLDQV